MAFIPPPELRGNSAVHWKAKLRAIKWLRDSGVAAATELRSQGVPMPLKTLKLTFEFIKPGRGDIDNFAIGLKHFVDGMIRHGLALDDDPDHVLYGEHTMRRPRPGEKMPFSVGKRTTGKTIVTIEHLV